jgi:hypothetical protein
MMNLKFKAKRDAAIKLENGFVRNKPRAITRNRIYPEDRKYRKHISKDYSRTCVSRGNKKIISKPPFDNKKNKSKNMKL